MSTAARSAAGMISYRMHCGVLQSGDRGIKGDINGIVRAIRLAQIEQDLIALKVMPDRAAIIARAEFARDSQR